MSPEISVVIPAYNEEDRLPTQLQALEAQTFGGYWEVVVADNGSIDGTAAVVAEWNGRIPKLRVVDASRAKGVNVARNDGVRASTADMVAICDADDRVHPRWLEAMYLALQGAPTVAGRLEIESVNPPEALAARPWRFEGLQPALGFLPYAVGANCAFRRSVFDLLEGFDEAFKGGCDDIDFFWRAQLAGFELTFAEDAAVDYFFRPRLGETLRQIRTQASQEPLLYLKHRKSGMPRPSVNYALRRWVTFLVVAPGLAISQRQRRKWGVRIAYRAGRAIGAVRHRVVYL